MYSIFGHQVNKNKTLKLYLNPVTIAIIKDSNAEGVRETLCIVGEIVYQYKDNRNQYGNPPQNLKQIPFDAVISLLSVYPNQSS